MKDLKRFDDALVAAMAAVTNTRFRESTLAKVARSVRLESLGNKMAKSISRPAIITSLHAVRNLLMVS